MPKKELMRLSKEQLAKACRNQGIGYCVDEGKAALADRLVESEVVEPEPSGEGKGKDKEEAPPDEGPPDEAPPDEGPPDEGPPAE